MKIRERDPKIKKQKIGYEVQRTPKVTLIEFVEALTLEEADKVGEIMLAYEQEKQKLIERLGELEDVKILNSAVAGQPVGIIVPDVDLISIKKDLGL